MGIDKAKAKLQSELEAMLLNLDQAQVMNAAMERKAKQFDTVISEWKRKVDSLTFDLDVTQKETRNISSDLFKIKSAYEETIMQLEEVRRENKTLSNEIKDIMDQISEGGHSIHEIDKIRKRLEAEKLELQAALEEAEATLEQEENKVLRHQLELTQVRQEIERRLAEKDEEFLAVRKNQAKALEALQGALETESKGKAEALRMKKKLETDVSSTNQAIAAAKRKMESELNTLSADLDEMAAEAKLSEEKAARAMIDAARLADELRVEQDVAMTLEKDRKLLEAQCKDAHARADEAETNALKVGRKAVIKMESRIRELESELDAETRRYADASKNFRKTERRIKELTFASDEDKKNHERMQALIDQLQGKVKSYKKQIEEAEEIAALNLAK